MIFSDIIALAKAGYTPADVREFLAAADKVPEKGSEVDQAEKAAETEAVENPVENVEKVSQPVTQQKATDEQEAGADYKKLYEETQQALKAAQAANTRQQQPDQETDEDIFRKAALAFM